jgi:hypothetical protein
MFGQIDAFVAAVGGIFRLDPGAIQNIVAAPSEVSMTLWILVLATLSHRERGPHGAHRPVASRRAAFRV